MKLTAHHDAQAFAELEPQWNDLLRRGACDQIFTTWEWQSSWWAAYDAGELWIVTIQDDAGAVIAIAPWFIETGPTGERVVRTVGCVDVTDYVDVIVDPRHTAAAYAMLAEHLDENADRYDRVNLCNIPEASPTREGLAAELERHGFQVELELQEVCPVIPLPRTFEDYLARLDKKQRHEIRRKVRRAETEGEATWRIVGPDDDIEAELDRFLALMESSHPTKAEFLRNPKHVAFFRRIIPLTHARGWLQLAFLSLHGQVTASYLNFDYGDRILVYNSGLQPEPYGVLSPGIVLLAYLIEHAIEEERHVFDFLRGNETYKYRMGAVDTRVYKLKARRGQR